jgi:hypothetical protein
MLREATVAAANGRCSGSEVVASEALNATTMVGLLLLLLGRRLVAAERCRRSLLTGFRSSTTGVRLQVLIDGVWLAVRLCFRC